MLPVLSHRGPVPRYDSSGKLTSLSGKPDSFLDFPFYRIAGRGHAAIRTAPSDAAHPRIRGFYVKRVFGLVVICGAASCVAALAAPVATPHLASSVAVAGKKAAAPKLSASELAKRAAAKEAARHAAMLLLAPADEYFGPLKLSIIGMQNTIRDLGRKYDVNHDIPKQTFTSAQLVERSVRDWAKRYGKDDQLPRVVYFLQRLYTKVLLRESRDRAGVTAKWLIGDFPHSPQAKQLVKTLAVEHLAPLPPPTPEPTATPLPEPTYSSIFGRAYPSEFAPTPLSSPTPLPSATPIAKPTR